MDGQPDEEAFLVDQKSLTNVKMYVLNVYSAMYPVEGILDSLELEDNASALTNFVSNPDTMSLFVCKAESTGIVCGTSLLQSESPQGMLVVVKAQQAPIDPSRHVAEQVNVITLGGGSAAVAATAEEQGSDASPAPTATATAAASHFALMQQYLKHSFMPLVQQQQPAGGATVGSAPAIATATSEKLNALAKALSDLDLVLEQIQRGDGIARPEFHTVSEITTAVANSAPPPAALQQNLEQYNPSNVDQLFASLNPPLLAAAGTGDALQSRDAFANEVHRHAKQWPAEISKVTRLVELPLSLNPSASPFANIAGEVSFWKDLDKMLKETKTQLTADPSVLLTKLVLKRTNRVSEQLISEAEATLDASAATVASCVSFTKDFSMLQDMAALTATNAAMLAPTALHPSLTRMISASLQHFLKYRFNSKVYDFTRAMRLFELMGGAIAQQLATILRNKNLFHCPLRDFLKVCDDAEEVFTVWRVEYVQVKTMLKEVATRNNRNEKVKNFQFDFDALQRRLQSIKQFREQHERMVAVTTSVLSGKGSSAGGEGAAVASATAPDATSNDAQAPSILQELSEAYSFVVRFMAESNVVMDVTMNGESAWIGCIDGYERRLEGIDASIVTLLTESLGACRSANDMFRVFSTYNPLFFRTTIRQAVNSSRAVLVKNVREDVLKLREKFKNKYDSSQEKVTSDLRDIPPLSGSILWARQIEKQFSTLMKRMEDLLGKGWESHVEGRQLKEICDELRGNLDTDSLYKEWVSVQLKCEAVANASSGAGVAGGNDRLLFAVEVDPLTKQKALRVNFDERLVVLFKEIHYLEWLLPSMNSIHKTIPSTLKDVAKKASARYPTAMALQGALSGMAQAKRSINASPSIAVLVSNYLLAVRESIQDAFGAPGGAEGAEAGNVQVSWESSSDFLAEWVQGLSQKVYTLQERVAEVIRLSAHIHQHIAQLHSCEYTREAFGGIINSIQLLVDEMQTKGYANIPKWNQALHAKIEDVLKVRLSAAIVAWVASFTAAGQQGTQSDGDAATERDASTAEAAAGSPTTSLVSLELTVHEIALANQCLFVSPPIEDSRVAWIRNFHAYIEVITSLPRISTSRYQVFSSIANKLGDGSNAAGAGGEAAEAVDFSSILNELDVEIIRQPFQAIEDALSKASAFAKQWLQYQTLWDVVSVSALTDSIDRRDVLKWQQLLGDIKAARKTIESNEEERCFGPIVVNYRQVQNKVNMKYDAWQKECQVKFGVILMEEIRATFDELGELKGKLEEIHFEGASTSTKEVIVGVELLRQVKEVFRSRKEVAAHLESGEKLLIKQRHAFPKDWIYVSNISAVLSDVQQIYDKRNAVMESQLPILQTKIYEEDVSITKRVNKFQSEWEAQRPVDCNDSAGTSCTAALQVIGMFASQLLVLQEEVRRINDAKEAIGMEAGGVGAGAGTGVGGGSTRAAAVASSFNDMTVNSISEELNDLRTVWSTVLPVFDKLDELRHTLLLKEGVTPLSIRKQLDSFLEELRNMPARIRSYAPYEYLQTKIAKYMGFQGLLRDICSDVLKERHWRVLIKNLSLPVRCAPGSTAYLSEITLGIIWESSANTQKKMIAEVLSTAQGEQALHQFLKEMREYWSTCDLTLAMREGGIRVIVGWEQLFTMLEDHLNSLASLKQSPYFGNVPEFHEDTATWEAKLTTLRAIFEIWIEVQRKWVYLRGIFKNPDIKAQLPAQYSKYKSVDNEFTSLLKKINMKPAVLDLLLLDNLPRQLERQDGAMSMIQKALGEYLERQRQMFPRFYFVNNDDLVEILGNANEPAKVMGHLGKMFAGINSMELTKVADSGEASGNAASAAAAVKFSGISMSSKDGEVVKLLNPVSISSGNVKEWLIQLESNMIVTLATSLQESVQMSGSEGDRSSKQFIDWIEKYPAQVIGLCSNVMWTLRVEQALQNHNDKGAVKANSTVTSAVAAALAHTEEQLRVLSEHVLGSEVDVVLRKKCEQLITAFVHQRDVVRALVQGNVQSKHDFKWLYHLRFYWNVTGGGKNSASSALSDATQLVQKLSICMSNASFFYGFEYLGIGERLVQTPLTDRCYLTLTQALHFRMGGNPFGPAGTGKTESVKMLGSELGRFVLVFNCDENFDYSAMGRIFAGLCQVGAWGCFDEFNRLEERILSAVSQQILTIQRGLMCHSSSIELLGNPCSLHSDVGIFVTMNPGYAGRSNLPDNLKQLFRGVAMTVPDRKMIAQVMLFSQGIVTAEELARKIVLLFTLCEEQLSVQSHYDFGLRALKSVLSGAGDLKRKAIHEQRDDGVDLNSGAALNETERDVLILSLCNNISPKLIPEDIPLFVSLLQSVFPDSELPEVDEPRLVDALKGICFQEYLEFGDKWVDKVLQLKQVLEMRHGVMMVGPSGSGKSTAWRSLLKALQRVDGVKGDYYVIDPKAMRKDKLFGSLDPNTLEWTDGVFTKILRKIIENNNIRSESSANSAEAEAALESNSNNTPIKGAPPASASSHSSTARRSWIVFDGDVDPEWAENLNSVLDDNKILTLPTGDRLKLPDNVRIMMEVETLKHATMATVSRCGMVWFAEDTVSVDMALQQQLNCIKDGVVLEKHAPSSAVIGGIGGAAAAPGVSAAAGRLSKMEAEVRSKFVDSIAPFFKAAPDLVGVALEFSLKTAHIMEPNRGRLLTTLFSMLSRGVQHILDYNDTNSDFPMSDDHIAQFTSKWLLYSLLWSFGGSMSWTNRCALGSLLASHSNVDLPSGAQLVDVQVNLQDGSWTEWMASVPRTDLESHKVITNTDVVVTTTDTVRHTEVMTAWLSSHKPLILCGPPGSGKTMTLSAVIEAHPEFILATLNFSSGTSPDILLKVFSQYCEVIESPEGLIMQPTRQSYSEDKWLIVFCDEINLPAVDKYGTQRVIMFMRQLTEQGGYWRNSDCKWIRLRRIQFVGACNAPSDAGRVSMSHRFMRHAPLMMVDYPAEASLKQIYKCFNSALLKLHPNLKGSVDALTNAMVEFYSSNQTRFTAEMAPQYIYSPRELSRWVRGMYEAMEPLEVMTMSEMVRLWAHEGLRLFQDRLMTATEKEWCDNALNEIAAKHFGNAVDIEQTLQRPLLYSSWLSKTYQSTKLEDFYYFVSARLKVFYEEELDVPLVLFDDVIAHVLRIDNVLRHPMGHMLLVGDSGVGKTVLTKFVAWMNGLKIFQIKANNRYTLDQFDEDLRVLLRRVALDGEKICFIFDESNVLSSAFLERMNSLLASGEVPGLFQGEDLAQLMVGCRDVFLQRDGLILDSSDEIWRQFTKIIQRNLHVVFTMNPANADFDSRCTTSPALFNRCVVDWFGTWSQNGLTQVAHEFTKPLDTGYTSYSPPSMSKMPASLAKTMEYVCSGVEDNGEPTLHNAVVAALVEMHNYVIEVTHKINKAAASSGGQAGASSRSYYVSPRDALDLVRKFMGTEQEKRAYLEEQQTHVRAGLNKLKETQEQVGLLQSEMKLKEGALKSKDTEANQKLLLMLEKQKEAEGRKSVAEELTVQLEQRRGEIKERKQSVESELAEAEPALVAAKHSVNSIRKAQLDELRALARPPNNVRLTLEAVLLMINGEKPSDWAEMRKLIRKDDFISTVVNFDPLQLAPKVVKMVQDEYFDNNPDLDYASVDRASKACGPLYQWADSQVKYAIILKKVKPLRDEVEKLEGDSKALAVQQKQAVDEVAQLEDILAKYKLEYATVIRETEVIRSEMENVTNKVVRAEALLNSLNEERDRWQETWQNFDTQMSTLIGDCLLSVAFLTYAGGHDQSTRRSMLGDWSDVLDGLQIPYRADMNLVDYLSSPADQLLWSEYGLATDELVMQNAILLQRFHRFPLVIDPSGQALSFLLKKFAAQKLTQTSFLDSSFLKTLASSIRFGTPLLVHDVESIDPILNPVLNREFQKTGGRTLVRLGNEDVDFSPKFMIILFTRNPTARFAPDLCSRVTLVNFTITHSSLESQMLSTILRNERPDVDSKRSEVLRLQSEQSVKLRGLEELLLSKISAIQGAILDDDSIIKTLEVIKKEAFDLNAEVRQTEALLQELKGIAKIYEPLASVIVTIYFTLEKLADVNYFYQFSLQYYVDIVQRVLQMHSTAGTNTGSGAGSGGGGFQSGQVVDAKLAKERLSVLTKAILRVSCKRVLRSLKYEDKLLFTARLAEISVTQVMQQASALQQANKSRGVTGSGAEEVQQLLSDAEYAVLYGGYQGAAGMATTPAAGTGAGAGAGGADLEGKLKQIRDAVPDASLDDVAAREVLALTKLPAFSGLLGDLTASAASWNTFLEAAEPENCVPMGWAEGSGSAGAVTTRRSAAVAAAPPSPTRACLLQLMLVRVFRPERVLHMMEKFVALALGGGDSGTPAGENDSEETPSKGGFSWHEFSNALDLHDMVTNDCTCATPILLCSTEAGQDISNKIDALAAGDGDGASGRTHTLLQVAMGSNEGYTEADKLLSLGMKGGHWVLLRNIHLCSTEWLELLERKVHGAGAGAGSSGPGGGGGGGTCMASFRLFLTCEMPSGVRPSIPAALLRACDTVIVEPSTGIKANLQRFLTSVVSQQGTDSADAGTSSAARGAKGSTASEGSRMDRAPHERSRLYALLGWLNAVIHERLRYAPYGWTKRYEFSDVDASCALNVIDQWVDRVSSGGAGGKNKSHVAPEDLPWDALRKLLLETLYGGRMDNAFDYAVLESFIGSIFRPEMYSSATPLVVLPPTAAAGTGTAATTSADDGDDSSTRGAPVPLVLPERLGRAAIEAWVAALPNTSSPAWIGLPLSAETERMVNIGTNLLRNMRSLTQSALVTVSAAGAANVPTLGAVPGTESGIGAGAGGSAFAGVLQLVERWLKVLPAADAVSALSKKAAETIAIPASASTEAAGVSPVLRFMHREQSRAESAITAVRGDVEYLRAVCSGGCKHSASSRMLLKQVLSGGGVGGGGCVPPNWTPLMPTFGGKDANGAASVGITEWIGALAERWHTLSRYYQSATTSSTTSFSYWLGGMFAPESFATATRQLAAQRSKWNLEDMELHLEIEASGEGEAAGRRFPVSGLWIECAHWDSASKCICTSASSAGGRDAIKCRLPASHLSWRLQSDSSSGAAEGRSYMRIPVYLDNSRTHRLFEVCIDTTQAVKQSDAGSAAALETLWLQRGIAVVAQALGGL